jgi:hypothetical protein
MIVATWLLFVLGGLGATDILLFHTIAQSIRRHPAARQELITHSLRGPTYAALFVLVPNCVMQGAWFWVLVALLAVDLAISVWDFAIERESRAFFGGLPTGEYVLHVFIAIVFGALITAVLFEAAPWASAPTRLAWEPAPVPAALRWAFLVMAALVLASGLLDLRAVLRLGPRSRASEGRRAPRVPDATLGTSP